MMTHMPGRVIRVNVSFVVVLLAAVLLGRLVCVAFHGVTHDHHDHHGAVAVEGDTAHGVGHSSDECRDCAYGCPCAPDDHGETCRGHDQPAPKPVFSALLAEELRETRSWPAVLSEARERFTAATRCDPVRALNGFPLTTTLLI